MVLSERYITDRFLPDKAIDLLDEACSDVNLRSKELSRLAELRKERDAAVADIRGVMRNAADTCYRCKHRFGDSAAERCIDCEDGSNWEWRGVVDETD